ncbi:MAG: radical SAM protein [Thermoplasmata archaeon]|nr:radical SAM protein [Thermoplasmata archaeon]
MVKSRILPNQSFVKGAMPISCVMCQEGAKMVLLVTGKCAHDCYYCPLSSKKKGKDVTYADEKLVQSDADVIFEARSIGARGTGITGGDPLMAMDRTIHYIRLLKSRFGRKHNIHLYTATPDPVKIRKLAQAGLNEIRFHPAPDDWNDLARTKYPGAIKAALEAGMRTGLEIPSIPGMEKEMISLANVAYAAGAEFINLNELEFSESNWQALGERGFKIKDDVSSAVLGSQEAAGEVEKALEGDMIVHYCSSSFKDATQLRNRLQRRALNLATQLEIITDEATYLKGIIETREPEKLVRALKRDYGIPAELVRYDPIGNRVEIAAWVLEELPPGVPGKKFMVWEYPTADRLEVERQPIG